MIELADRRERMVRTQIEARGVSDRRVLDAMRRVRREAFVPPDVRDFAYEDRPLPIAEGQTISQPYIVALMVEAAQVEPGDHVLEIGAGSGYAAAILAQIADHVWTIERHGALAEQARRALHADGCENVEVRHGDGAHGWKEAAPFDAILVAAGSPRVPPPLKRQLKVGGRLVIPVGDSQKRQSLVRLTRTGDDTWEEDDLGPVAFVPLVGDHGWPEKNGGISAAVSSLKHALAPKKRKGVAAQIAQAAEPLPDFEDEAFGALFDRFAEARVVMLGEATHGTSEFYRARAAITRRLIERHGFDIVAIEADWPDAAAVDRYVRHRPGRPRGDKAFHRFPLWMWRNHETHDFIEWMRARNAPLPMEARAGFYGLDIYSLGASMGEVIAYLDKVDPEAAAAARERYGCLTPWQKDPAVYGRAALTEGFPRCEKAVGKMLGELLERRLEDGREDSEQLFDATQNARLVAAAERYYRIMYFGSRESWNLRDTHMFETLERIMEMRGPQSKAVVWAHNSHIGDASATEMGAVLGELNIGQLCRERFGDQAALIGFGTDRGTVAAATDWDGEMEIKTVRRAAPESYECLCRESGVERFLLDLGREAHPDLRAELMSPRLERAIGVIYRPDTERQSHYFEASLPDQFDAWVWFEETHAVAPLPSAPPQGAPDTYPFGI